ncbi:MAG: Copper binding protein plastocyanin/azurin family [Candidatus Eremiobacteraeota bacterium]|nr:Copper binding protein plastocyanin/azurin family [Candidatus Eremiobacteraeota bacterium]
MRSTSLLLLVVLAACTPGAPSAGAANAGATTSTSLTTIDVSLTTSTVVATAFGSSGGFTPAIVTVPLGSTIRFVNVDSFAHTSSSFDGTAFPAGSPLGGAALNTSGDRLSTGWTSGNLAAGASSQPLLADKAGTYLYGCFYHYGAPMRAAILVR